MSTENDQSGSLHAVVGLRASDRKCPNCRSGFELDYSHPTEWRLKECSTCGGTGRVQIDDSPKPNQ